LEEATEKWYERDIADIAKEIRAILKKDFPNFKFRVQISRYSMGESIDISWTDGPAYDKINRIAEQFEHIDRDQVTGEILSGGNRYVHCHREYSEDVRRKAEDELWDSFVEGSFTSRSDYNFQSRVWRKLQEEDFEKPPVNDLATMEKNFKTSEV